MSNPSQQGRVALIVGAGRGLGRVTALELGRRGYAVVAASRTPAEIERTANDVAAAGGRALAVPCDATQEAQVAALVVATLKAYGRIDVLVNCAGEALLKPTAENTLADFERIITSNLTSVFLTCRAVLEPITRQPGGHIINVSSRVAKDGAATVAAYTAAKAGVVGFSKALAQELKPLGVKVTAICPSPMNTPMRWAATPNWDRAKVIEPERVAELIAWLIADPAVTLDEVYPFSVRA